MYLWRKMWGVQRRWIWILPWIQFVLLWQQTKSLKRISWGNCIHQINAVAMSVVVYFVLTSAISFLCYIIRMLVKIKTDNCISWTGWRNRKRLLNPLTCPLKSMWKSVFMILTRNRFRNFSAVESVGNELKKQLDDIMVSREYKDSNCTKRTIMMHHAFSFRHLLYSFGKVIFVT